MNKKQITTLLSENHISLVNAINDLPHDRIFNGRDDKWSAAQHLSHILLTVKPVLLAFSLPRFIIRWRFGKANRPSKTYDDLVKKYQFKLSLGGKAPAAYVPRTADLKEKMITERILMHKVNALCQKVNDRTESDLDTYILPHPLLGKVTLREILFFTAYHAEHHRALIERDNN